MWVFNTFPEYIHKSLFLIFHLCHHGQHLLVCLLKKQETRLLLSQVPPSFFFFFFLPPGISYIVFSKVLENRSTQRPNLSSFEKAVFKLWFIIRVELYRPTSSVTLYYHYAHWLHIFFESFTYHSLTCFQVSKRYSN